jgi:hypothetical protein
MSIHMHGGENNAEWGGMCCVTHIFSDLFIDLQDDLWNMGKMSKVFPSVVLCPVIVGSP